MNHIASHHATYQRIDDTNVRSSRGLVTEEGVALVRELIESNYLLYSTFRAYWDLFLRTKNLRDEKILSFVSRSFLEIYERRLSFLAQSPNARARIRNYMFISAHIIQGDVVEADRLIKAMIRNNNNLSALSRELDTLRSNNQLRAIATKMSFTDRSYANPSQYLNEGEINNMENLYAVYSLAILGDPFAGHAFSEDKWHFLLPKTFQILLSCEVAELMSTTLSEQDCIECKSYKQKWGKKGIKIKAFVSSNIDIINPTQR